MSKIENNYDSDIDISEFTVQLINNYMKFYKNVNNINKPISLIDGLVCNIENIENIDKTNKQLERFYEELNYYKTNENTSECEIHNVNNENIEKYMKFKYGIFTAKNNLIYVSNSLLSLLIELCNLENEYDNNEFILKEINNT